MAERPGRRSMTGRRLARVLGVVTLIWLAAAVRSYRAARRQIDELLEAGTGLGLSIVKRIAELHRARIDFRDGPGSRGLAVVVEFPAA
jgi:signal transduction histidine kinase